MPQYVTVIFGLPKHENIDFHLVFARQTERSQDVICVLHDPQQSDIPCEYDGLHYHCITSFTTKEFKNDTAWATTKELLSTIGDCTFPYFKKLSTDSGPQLPMGIWKHQRVFHLPSICTYLQLPGKEIVFNNTQEHSYLWRKWTAVTNNDLLAMRNKKIEERKDNSTAPDNIEFLERIISESKGAIICYEDLLSYKAPHDADNNRFRKLLLKTQFQNLAYKAFAAYTARYLYYTLDELLEDWYRNVGEHETDKYYGVNESLAIVRKWCQEQGINFCRFKARFRLILDKKKDKLNTFLLIGRSNAGKSYITDVRALCKTYGEVNGSTDYNFAFQNCVKKRVVAMEELMIGPSSVDLFKRILGGEGAMVRVKNKMDAYCPRVPIIITANDDPTGLIMKSVDKEAIKNRCFAYYHLNPVDWLEFKRKRLSPLWLWTSTYHPLQVIKELDRKEVETVIQMEKQELELKSAEISQNLGMDEL